MKHGIPILMHPLKCLVVPPIASGDDFIRFVSDCIGSANFLLRVAFDLVLNVLGNSLDNIIAALYHQVAYF